MQEVRTILVPVDFSAHSRAAALRACELADVSGASIRLIHALDLPAIAKQRGLAHHLYDELRRSEKKKLADLLADLAHRKLRVSGTLEEREPNDMIAEAAASEDVDLIVMGTHGYRGLDRMFLGSVAERTIMTTGTPVMTVKENEWDAASKIRRILLAVDPSSGAEAAAALAIGWAGLLGAEIEVVHVVEDTSNSSGTANWSRQAASERLDAMVHDMSEQGISAIAELMDGPAAIGIEKRSEAGRFDLLVLGRSKAMQSSRGFFGSVSASLLKRVKCSVLLGPGMESGSATEPMS